MRSPEDNLERIFIRAPYTIHYRRLKRVKWSVEMYANYTALFMLGGQMKIQCGEVGGDLNEHSVLLLNPGEQASARGMESEFLTASLSSSYVVDCAVRARLIRSGAVVSFHKSIIEPGASMTRLSRDLRQELLHREAGQELVISAIVDQMVVQLLRHHSHVRRSDELELSRAGLVDRRIRRAVELMNAQLHRDLPLSEIAAAAYISPFHFARVFKKLTGATPHAYLASLRATRAQTLLAETDLSVTEVGARVGYASSSHFSKAFRGATGMTPRSFRSALVKRMDD
jgi:AraC family transcriptional regulator